MGDVTLSGRYFENEGIIYALRVSDDGALVSMPYNTAATHAGKFFFTNFYNAAIAAAGTIDVLVVTGATTTPHLAVMVDIGAASTLSIYEAVTASNNGTALSVYNANRQSTKVTTAAAYHTPTITGTGTTLMLNHYIAGGTTGNATGGSSSDFARVTEFVLKASTKYLFRVTNIAAGATAGSVQLGWYENV